MKKLALFIGSISLLCTGKVLAAVELNTDLSGKLICVVSSDCEDIGYTDTAGSCTNYVACPFNTSKIKCLDKDCSGYTLASCPQGGACSVCQNSSGTKYKLNSCNEGYKVSGSTCAAKTCSDYGYSTLPSGSVCTTRYSKQLGATTGYCYSGCKLCNLADATCKPRSIMCPSGLTTDRCYTQTTRSISGYSYGTCTCCTTATCGGTNVLYCPRITTGEDLVVQDDRPGTTCSGGARGSTCSCGGTHTAAGVSPAHVCVVY